MAPSVSPAKDAGPTVGLDETLARTLGWRNDGDDHQPVMVKHNGSASMDSGSLLLILVNVLAMNWNNRFVAQQRPFPPGLRIPSSGYRLLHGVPPVGIRRRGSGVPPIVFGRTLSIHGVTSWNDPIAITP